MRFLLYGVKNFTIIASLKLKMMKMYLEHMALNQFCLRAGTDEYMLYGPGEC